VENEHAQLKELVEGCVIGKRKSQEKLFKMFYGKMLSVCMRYTKDQDNAQEILQEGFIKVFDKLETFDFNGSFEGWVRRIMVNTAIDSIRRAKRDPFLAEDETNTFVDEGHNPMDENEFLTSISLKAEVAMRAIQQLSPAYQAVFNLYVFENQTHKEIGEILGISEGTSKSNFAKAKANLKKVLEEQLKKLDNY
jgi:RNA polymerase sigma-70 factor, ECF subfamily